MTSTVGHRGQVLASTVSLSMLLTGCAGNPTVTWQPQAETGDQLDSMATARADAASLKRALDDKASTFVGTKVALNDALLGLGVLSIGLGVGKAHRDAYVGVAGLAGTAYLFGNQGLQEPTLQAYQSGIGAVNCAVAAVRPLQVTGQQITQVTNQAKDLQKLLPDLARKQAAAEAAVAAAALPTALGTAAQQQLADARATYAKAAGANADAATLEPTVTRAAGGLKGLLAEIHASVNKLVSKSVVDPASIPAALNSLVKVVSGFAPGLGVDAFLTQRLAAANLAPKSSDGGAQGAGGTKSGAAPASQATAVAALEALAESRQQVANLADPLAAQLALYKNQDEAAALKSCGVSDAASVLHVDRTELVFAGGSDVDQSKAIAVSGGTKPYSARFRDSPTRGVEAVNPLPGDRSIDVRVPKGTPAGLELGLMVTDASSPPQIKLVLVRTQGATAPGPAADPVADELQKAQAAKDAMPMKAGDTKANRYVIAKVVADQGHYKLTLSCTPGSAKATDTADAVAARLVDWLGNERKLTPRPDPELKAKLKLDGGDPCLKG